MLKNNIKIAFRNLLRFKEYTLINLFGLALGLTIGVLILLFVSDELSFDQFHTKGSQIYKVVTDNSDGSIMETNAWPVAEILATDYPEVEKASYSRKASSTMMVNYEGKEYEHDMYYADNAFFNIFSFDFIEGEPTEALKKPYTIVITEDIRNRYFGSELVLGKTLTIRDTLSFTITGVIENVPSQSHIQFEMLASFSTYEQLTDWFSYTEGWGNFNVRNYILVKEGADINALRKKTAGLYMDGDAGDQFREWGVDFKVDFVPLSDIYLKSKATNGFGSKGSIDQVYLVSGIAAFVILLACINFVNLTTARSVYRAREVGVRKIVGSTRRALMFQFLFEAFLLTLAALGVAIILIDFSLPFFNDLMGKDYSFTALLNIQVMGGMALLLIIVSLFSGYYPALVLSGYKPIQVLKGRIQNSGKGIKLRRALVIFQFFTSGSLVLAMLIVLGQLDYMRNQDLGFDKEQILILDATRVPKSESIEAFQNSLNTLNSVERVSFTNALPGRPGWLGQWAYPETMENGEQVDTEYMAVDENYIDALGLELLSGRNFDLNNKAELDEGVIINETTAKEMGWFTPEEAIGKNIVSPSQRPQGKVIGVVKDFHGLGLQQKIWAQVMDYSASEYGRYFAIRFHTGKTSDLISDTKVLWSQYLGDTTYDYFFLDQDFDRQYKSEERLMSVFVVFALLTVVIAVIGLLGLVSFMVISRTKEIGIRKVLGAGVLNIATLLSKEFVILVVIANVIAIPVVWYFANQWLANFAFHMEVNAFIFVITFIVTVFIAAFTVSFQSIKAGMLNPVETLRGE